MKSFENFTLEKKTNPNEHPYSNIINGYKFVTEFELFDALNKAQPFDVEKATQSLDQKTGKESSIKKDL